MSFRGAGPGLEEKQMRGTPKSTGERIWSILLFILGLTIMVSSVHVGFGRFTKPGPGLFPFLCGIILSVQSIALYLVKQKKPEAKDDLLKNPGAVPKFLGMMVTLVLWIFLMPLLGWLPLTFLVTLSVSKIMHLEGWIKPLLLAGANTLFSYILFGYLLIIDLPNGFWA
jgi:putative tricarboxylic transport membrane protein